MESVEEAAEEGDDDVTGPFKLLAVDNPAVVKTSTTSTAREATGIVSPIACIVFTIRSCCKIALF